MSFLHNPAKPDVILRGTSLVTRETACVAPSAVLILLD